MTGERLPEVGNVAARLYGARDIRLGPAEMPVPEPGEVLLRVGAVGLCGSDLHWYQHASIGGVKLSHPLVLGHEFSGVIASGPRTGERVVVDPAQPCTRCATCEAGNAHLCPDTRFLGLDPHDGALQAWLAVRDDRCVPLPASISDHEAVLLEVLGIALHAFDLARDLGLGSDMATGVYGAGPVGQMVIRVLRAHGVRTIIAADPLAHRAAAARHSGASDALVVPGAGSGTSPVGGLDPSAGISVDVAFECSGEDAALDMAIRTARPGGTVLLVGIPRAERATFLASPFRRKEMRLQAVRRMRAQDLGRAVESVVSGKVSLDGLVTAIYGLSEVGSAFQHAVRREGLKIVVAPGK